MNLDGWNSAASPARKKWTFEQVSKGWTEARDKATDKESFQKLWSEVLEESGWTRFEFHEALDKLNRGSGHGA